VRNHYNTERLIDLILLKWVFETSGSVETSREVVDGTVFLGSNDKSVYALKK